MSVVPEEIYYSNIKLNKLYENLFDEQFVRQVKYINDSMWYYYSVASIIPLAIFFVYRYLYPKTLSSTNSKKDIIPDIWDRLVQACIFYGPIYYIFDLYVYFALGNYDVCFGAFTLHHLTTLFLVPQLIALHYYKWFQLGIPLFHSCLFYFKDSFFIEICYLFSIVLFHYGIRTKECREQTRYQLANKGLFLIYLSITIMFFGNCRDM